MSSDFTAEKIQRPVIDTETYNRYFEALIIGDRAGCTNIVDRLENRGISMLLLYENLFKPSLYQVGVFWERNRISVATEHMATALTETLMNRIFAAETLSRLRGKRVVIASIESERHFVGAKMVADVFETNGWDGYYLGGDVPTPSLLDFIQQTDPDLVGLSLSIYSNLPVLEKIVSKVQGTFKHLKVLVGGQAFQHGGEQLMKKRANLCFIPSLAILDKMLKQDAL